MSRLASDVGGVPEAGGWPGLILLGIVGAALVGVSARLYFREARAVLAPGGSRFDASRFTGADMVVGGLIVAWFLVNTLPLLLGGADAEALASGVITREALVLSMLLFVAVVVMVLGFLVFRGVPVGGVFGFRRMPFGRAMLMAGGMLLAAYPLMGVAALAGQLLPGEFPRAQGIVEFFLRAENPGDRLLVIVLAVVVAPVCEEFLFRGYLYGALKRGIGLVGAIGVTSLLFALIHGHVPSLAVFFVLAVCLGIAFEKSGSLIVPMAMHSLFNAVSVCVMMFLPMESL